MQELLGGTPGDFLFKGSSPSCNVSPKITSIPAGDDACGVLKQLGLFPSSDVPERS